MPVALAGRVPVNVTNEGGAIATGDGIYPELAERVTTSSTAGKAMKHVLRLSKGPPRPAGSSAWRRPASAVPQAK